MTAARTLAVPTPTPTRALGLSRLATVPSWDGSRPSRLPQPVVPGVHLPFLSPLLRGVRLRAGPAGAEFILPNPSGGRGVYVADWSVVAGFAAPNLHDSLLVGRLSGFDRIGPAEVRQAGLSVALDGHAGDNATAAARQAERAIEMAVLRLRAQLLMRLAWRAGLREPAEATRCLERPGFDGLAVRLGWNARQLAEAIEAVSIRHASIAIGTGTGHTGRWGRLLAMLHRLRLSLAEEQFKRGGADAVTIGRIIAATDRRIGDTMRLLPAIATMLNDPLPLLEAWRDGELEGGADWLHGLETALDGWDRICLLWSDAATPRLRQALIPELAAMTGHVGTDGWNAGQPPGEIVTDADGVQSGWQRQVLARNERVRALELAFELEAA